MLHNEDLGSVITWDFDVLRHSVCFSVFCTKKSVASALPPQPVNGLNAFPQSTLIQPEPLEKSVIDKSWKEGHDYVRIEASTVCHDGESVQVS